MLSRSGRAGCALAAFFMLAALLPAPAFAQFDTSTVLGAVKDSIGCRGARRDRDPEERRDRHHRPPR